MPTPFGPQLIGETEKTLHALLLRFLHGTGLSEPQWVTLRLAGQDAADDEAALAAEVADRAHFPDADALVASLQARGLLDGGRLSADGRQLVEDTQAAIAGVTAPIWDGLAPADVAAATAVLNEVIGRARVVLATVA